MLDLITSVSRKKNLFEHFLPCLCGEGWANSRILNMLKYVNFAKIKLAFWNLNEHNDSTHAAISAILVKLGDVILCHHNSWQTIVLDTVDQDEVLSRWSQSWETAPKDVLLVKVGLYLNDFEFCLNDDMQ